MDEGAAFGFFPQLRPRRRLQDPTASADVPLQVLRGRLAGLLGLPSDIGNIVRTPQPMEAFGSYEYEQPQQLPYTTEQFLKELPLAPTSPVGQLAGQAASFVPLNPMPLLGGAQRAIKAARTSLLETSPRGEIYETAQQGPFYRVARKGEGDTSSLTKGIREQGQEYSTADTGGIGGNVPTRLSNDAIKAELKNPSNFVRQSANQYTQSAIGKPYEVPNIPESSLAKQSGIGRVFELALEESPAYKKAVFDSYAKQMPEVIEKSGAKNYDDLMEKAYLQLSKETQQQFNNLPVSLSFHKGGEGQYASSNEMLQDIFGNKHLYVYQGGSPHDFLNQIDKRTGLNSNEMFRAVHDFYGHGVQGNQFGPKGEEIAFAVHGNMYSPLAKIAMASETRGQNSFVNYTPINADLKSQINKFNEEIYYAKRRGDTAAVNTFEKAKQDAFQGFEFAPQKSVLLPADYIKTDFQGGVPDYIAPLIKPKAGTTTESALTHYSTQPNLTETDPTRYGTGIAGEELQRLLYNPAAVTDRTYFYAGEPGSITPELGLGPYRYRAQSSGLYDVAQDPLGLRTLAAESNRTPWTSQVNPGVSSGGFTDVERMVKEYGYEGLLNPELSLPTAIMYKPTPVQMGGFLPLGLLSDEEVRRRLDEELGLLN